MLISAKRISALRFGEFALDRARRKLLRAGEPVALSAKAFDLLVFLVENSGRPLSKDEILQGVWPDAIVEEGNLTQNMFLLRKALGPAGQEFIVTLPGRGYQFTAFVEELAAPAAEPPIQAAVLPTVEGRHSHLIFEAETEDRIEVWRSPLAMGFIAGGVALLIAVGWLGWQRYEDRVGGAPVQLVMSDLEGSTGDSVLDGAIVSALRIDLAQSPFVTVLSAATVRQTMAQMMHKPDDPLPPVLARDLCERTGSQGVLKETVARTGEHYLMTVEAINCVDGTTLGAATREASSREDIPHALDKLTVDLRHRLGESRRGIARFDAPLFPGNTGSIEALETYSQGVTLGNRGKLPEAIALLNRAVELDRQFAGAYLNLAQYYTSMGDEATGRTMTEKAYALRSNASAISNIYITAHYNEVVTGDLYAAVRNYQSWTELYPRTPAAWVGLAQAHRSLGEHTAAVAAYQHALALNPHIPTIYYGLSLEQIHSGDIAGARATCELAFSRGIDDELIHYNLVKVATLQHDPGLAAAQAAWAEAHPNASHVFLEEANVAFADGNLPDAQKLVDRATESLKEQGLTTLAHTYQQNLSAAYADMGKTKQARALLHIAAIDPASLAQLASMTKVGEAAEALKLLDAQLAQRPNDTAWHHMYAPQIRARAALVAKEPGAAIAALEPSRGFESTGLDFNWLRGRAYLLEGQPKLAAAEFRAVLAHPEVDPTSYILPLSQAGLTQALAQQ